MSGSTSSTAPLRALVVEDEWPARNYLVELIEAPGGPAWTSLGFAAQP